jgi:hypothetical protein
MVGGASHSLEDEGVHVAVGLGERDGLDGGHVKVAQHLLLARLAVIQGYELPAAGGVDEDAPLPASTVARSPAAGQACGDRIDGGQVVRVREVEDSVGLVGGVGHQLEVVKRAHQRSDAVMAVVLGVGGQLGSGVLGANEGGDVQSTTVLALKKQVKDGAANVAGCAGKQHLHDGGRSCGCHMVLG